MESLKFMKNKLLWICCAIPVIAILAIIVFKIPIGNLSSLAFLLPCLLMHLFMMKGHGDHPNGKDDPKSPGKSCH